MGWIKNPRSRAVIKTLQKIGNSYSVIIDRAIMDLLNMAEVGLVRVEFFLDRKGLLITPIGENEAADLKTRVRKAAVRVTDTHRATFKTLAE